MSGITIFAALAASSLLPAVLISALYPLTGEFNISSFVVSFFVALPFSIAANVALGLPAFLLLRRLGKIRWWTAALSGVVLGAAFSVIIRLPGRFDWHDLEIIVPLAVVSSITFWFIARLGEKL